MTTSRLVARGLGLVLSLSAASTWSADPAAYRCDDRGRITYADQPCASGLSTTIVDRAPAPTADDRASADARRHADQVRLRSIEATRDEERRQDARAAALAARRNESRGKEAASCNKLALRARRAHEDFDRAGPRELQKAGTRMHRADDDFAALCRKR